MVLRRRCSSTRFIFRCHSFIYITLIVRPLTRRAVFSCSVSLQQMWFALCHCQRTYLARNVCVLRMYLNFTFGAYCSLSTLSFIWSTRFIHKSAHSVKGLKVKEEETIAIFLVFHQFLLGVCVCVRVTCGEVFLICHNNCSNISISKCHRFFVVLNVSPFLSQSFSGYEFVNGICGSTL